MDRFINLMNKYGSEKEPFMFIIDYDMKCPEIHKLDSIPSGVIFSTPLLSNCKSGKPAEKPVTLKKNPVDFSSYIKAFNIIQKNINLGNSYLLNLTFPTVIETDLTLENIYYSSVARYKLLYHNKFVVFSPEIFVRIKNGEIKSFPMKGTIDSSVKDAERVLLADKKEEAEHNTIVDLIRNDLSKVADNVEVTRYRFIDRINSGNGEMLQASSEITGKLKNGFESQLGDIIASMLPAGSVTGAPKKVTIRIINENETYKRGWYTGIFGVFDGKSLDSGVMIRFIEKQDDKFIFKSGGGITCMSEPIKEYEELIAKVYVPVG
jgi:para-aminobenzoate synthetase component 1